MPLTTLSDLERRLRKLEMLYDQDRHKISPPDRNVNTSHPLDVQTASPGVTDHGALTGLGDNDHPQYLLTTAKAADSELLDGIDSTGFVQTSGNQTIGGVKTFSSLPTLPTGIPTANQPVRKGYADLAYLSILATAQNSDKLDNLDSTAFALAGHDHNAAYLGISAKAADSDKLDNIDSTGFVQTSGNQTVDGTKTFSSIPVLPASNPTTANQAVRKGYADGAYLGINSKAADSDKLDGIDSTGFATAGHNHSGVYLPVSGKASDSDKLDGLNSTDFGRPVFLSTPLTSTAWDGDAKSTTAKTLIDLSSVFGAPAGIKGIFVRLVARDSGSSEGYCQLALSPNSTADSVAIQCYLQGVANDVYVSANGIVPCNANGDIYYQVVASGTNTLDAFIEIWGYWL